MEMRMTWDLIVVGGGPAGCAAAITAARAGNSVLLLERGRFPRHKVCGEFVSSESLGLLHDLVASRSPLLDHAPRISHSRLFIDGAVLSAEINPAAASIARYKLDSALWDSCIRIGVSAREATTVKNVEGRGPFRINTSIECFLAKAVINASGRWSSLTSPATRASVASERWIGIKAHFRERAASPSVDLYFFPGGYCGVQPVSSPGANSETRINACAMVRADVATCIEEVLRCNPELMERSKRWARLTEPVTTSPLVFHRPEPVAGSIIQVGDAATFVDPFIGDGISLALRSGNLAAECLQPHLDGKCSIEQSLGAYHAAYMQRLTHVFRNSSRLRNMLRWPRVVRRPVLSLLQRTPALTRQLVRMTR